MPRLFCALLICTLTSFASSQQSPAPATANSTTPDPVKLAAAVQGSYYHPDNLQSLHCDVTVDWPTLFAQLKMDTSKNRMQDMKTLKIQSQAARGMIPEVTFDWGTGTINTKDQIESGLRQIVSGFYQAYWPMFASPWLKSTKEFNRIEPLPDGASRIYESESNMNTIITVDKTGLPTHYAFEGLAAKGTIDPKYIDSPKQTPGDIRRLTGILMQEQTGSTNFNVQIDLDYQPAGAFNIPRHVSFAVVSAYAVRMEFTNCTANSAAPAR